MTVRDPSLQRRSGGKTVSGTFSVGADDNNDNDDDNDNDSNKIFRIVKIV